MPRNVARMQTGSRSTSPRSLAEDLRGRDDAALARLLVLRPDLAHPAPADLTSLAARACTRVSVHRALADLDRPTLQVAVAVVALQAPVSSAALARACGATGAVVAGRVQQLQELGLLWGTGRALRPVRALAELLGPYPAGLGPWLEELGPLRSPQRLADVVSALGLAPAGDPLADLEQFRQLLADDERFRTLLETMPPGCASLLERLGSGTPVGSVQDAGRAMDAGADGPVDWLMRHGLLVPLDADRVLLPREVGLALRGGRVHHGLDLEPPTCTGTSRPPGTVDAAGAGAATEAVRLVGELLALWGQEGPAALRSGGLGVRDLRRVAQKLDVPEGVAARVVELAGAADLVGDDGEADPVLAPTTAADSWSGSSVGARWETLARAWLVSPRSASTVGTRDDKGSVRAALCDAVARPGEAALRRSVLDQLGRREPGSGLDADGLTQLLGWRAPRGPVATSARALPAVLTEAAWLGLTAFGAATTHARELLGAAAGAAANALDTAAPPPVEHVLLQNDLTAVAPGPLAPGPARELSLMAEIDSRGGATVFRFTPSSVRRALDAGRTADELLTRLTALSRTPVPQALDYLLRDTSRRHGHLRVGSAGSYLRSDDEGALAELLLDRRAGSLQLRRLAPTVLASPADPETLLTVLRSLGLAPVAEGADGAVVLHRAPAPRRAPAPARRPPAGVPPVGSRLAEAVVRALRAGEDGSAHRAREQVDAVPTVPVLDPATSLALLRRAASGRRAVWVAVSDPTGSVSRRLVEPLSVEGGRVTVLDVGHGGLRTLSVHRLTGVLDDSGGART